MTFRVGRKGTLVPDFTAELTWSGTGQVRVSRRSPGMLVPEGRGDAVASVDRDRSRRLLVVVLAVPAPKVIAP